MFNCKDYSNKHPDNKIDKKHISSPLSFTLDFDDYGSKTLAYNRETISIDSVIWKNHEKDSILYINVNLKNLKIEPFVIKTSLVATKIPFLIQYQEMKKTEKNTDGVYINLNIVQQFNTIYSDSLVFKLYEIGNSPAIEQAFRLGYQKNGTITICALPVFQKRDTIDISNPKGFNICCIEKK